MPPGISHSIHSRMPNDSSGSATARTVIRLGSRRSELALRQTHMVRDALQALGHVTDVVTFSTVGDQRLDMPLPALGAKGVFTAELEAALLRGDVDLCVHSFKDLPTQSPEGLDIGAVLPREDPRDVLIVRAGIAEEGRGRTLDSLPAGIRVGTSSLRRGALLRMRRPDVRVVDVRGNVPTRLRKLDDGEMEALILAGAGIKRLGLTERITQWLDAPAWLPAPAQGVIAVQIRRDDHALRALLSHVHDAATWRAASAERSFLATLEGGCQVPVGALATTREGALWLDGSILDVDGVMEARGGLVVDDEDRGATLAGERLAASLLERGGAALLARAREAAVTTRG